MLKVYFIRHGKTEGNLLHRYIGRTDEHLCSDGIELLKSKSYPEIEGLYSSPMLRCIETAEILYSEFKPLILEDLRECDFGDYENKNYQELNGNKSYQKWIDSGGTLPFPGGESLDDFKQRCVEGFEKAIKSAMKNKYKVIALIVHGGTIMSILDKYSYPHKDYYNWQISNGEIITSMIDEEAWHNNNKRIEIWI